MKNKLLPLSSRPSWKGILIAVRGYSMAPDNNCDNVTASHQTQIPTERLFRKKLEPIFTSKCCIYKVPEILSRGNQDAYTPHLISIGPMHYKNRKLKEMEKQKLLYFNYFCERNKVTAEALSGCTRYLEDKENEIRNCYSEKFIDLNKNTFLQMIRLDAIFIIELFLRKAEEKDDYMLSKSLFHKGVERDLLLAENQLPFFVVKDLYEILKKQDDDEFLELARVFFQSYDPYHGKYSAGEINKKNDLLKPGWDNPRHFTDLIRFFYIPQDLTFERCKPSVVRDATKLKSAGISFKPVSDKCLLDVTLEKEPLLNQYPFLSCLPGDHFKAHLLFPKLTVDDSTEYVFCNLMAFEQCHYPQLHYICSYACLIDMLIGEKNDAAVLVESGVIVNGLSSEMEVTTLINKLCKNIVITSPGFGTLPEDLDEHYRNPLNKAVAELRLVYFSNLWKGAGTVVGLLLALSSISNIYNQHEKLFRKMGNVSVALCHS